MPYGLAGFGFADLVIFLLLKWAKTQSSSAVPCNVHAAYCGTHGKREEVSQLRVRSVFDVVVDINIKRS
jgi:hypothetical protein